VLQSLAALLNAFLEPRIPDVYEILRCAPLQEIASARELSVEADFGERPIHCVTPQRKPESSSRVKGLRIDAASSTTRIEWVPAAKVTCRFVSELRLICA